MNNSSLKTFASKARLELIEQVGAKLRYVTTGDSAELRERATQVQELKGLIKQIGEQTLIEQVAYTWFNRLAALRFLDARDWHPFASHVLTAATETETQPELLKLARSGALPVELRRYLDSNRVNGLLDGKLPSVNPQGEVYRHLVLAACRFYHALLPNVFEQLNDATELLLPDDLLSETSVTGRFRADISDADCETVELLGWLYQFYISDKKDTVMARKSAVPTEDIPAVTQLFTPHWIVRYLVENSLGRLWLLNRPGSRLREHMPYYIESGTDSSSEASAKEDFLRITKPEDIRLCDPAVGSGHMLTYAFDLFYRIYEEEGYAPNDIPGLILRHNLCGLEICPRAAQLAELALVFKAREKSRRFFQPEHLVRPHIIELRDVRFAENELRDYIHALGLGDLFNQPMLRLLHQFEEAKNFGSLIQPCLDERAIADVRRAIEAKDLGGQLFLRETHIKVLRVLEQAEALTQRYHVVVANPPYMGAGAMNGALKNFLDETLPQGKADLYSAFIERNLTLAVKGGVFAMITIPNWLFLGSFEELRVRILKDCHLASMLHNGRGVWGGDFGSAAFVIVNQSSPGHRGSFRRLFQKQGEIQSNDELQANFSNTQQYPVYRTSSADFSKIPGQPIAYWITDKMRSVFECNRSLGESAKVCEGMNTANNELFLRYWQEIEATAFGLGFSSRTEAAKSTKRWFPYLKGGDYRKWYGNHSYVVNWEGDGHCIREEKNERGKTRANIRNQDYFFSNSVNWSYISASYFSARLSGGGFIFDGKSPAIFAEDLQFVISLLNSSLATVFLSIIDPTIKFSVGAVGRIPLLPRQKLPETSAEIARKAIQIASADWDNFETSWDFRDQPLLRPGLKGATLEASWRNWEAQSTAAIRRMQELETENNRLFIAAYGLDGELQPAVPEAQITLARAEARRDMAAWISYAVGCMMGRYSPHHPGLILANAGDTLADYNRIVGIEKGEEGASDQWPVASTSDSQATFQLSTHHSSPATRFHPDEDGIIPVLDGEWFEDDIVARVRDFLRVTFGESSLGENIRFIETSLGKDLRKYFANDFFKDHLQTYKKRPIYWLVQSPKKSFQALIYLHRYNRDTFNLLLNDYLREFQNKLQNRRSHLNEILASESTSPRDKTAATKEQANIDKQLTELSDWERDIIYPLATQRIEIDLDDGVKANYPKFGKALAPIPGVS